MNLSVVVPTLNGRDRLARTLDALADLAPGAEVVVVNGPSADGTTGMVRERDDVDVLVEVADRTAAVARNAGIDRTTGDVVAFVDHGLAIRPGWIEAIEEGLDDSAVVTGPTLRQLHAGRTTETVESRTVARRSVTYFNSGNVAFDRTLLDTYDGFDEYLERDCDRDLAHRIAGGDDAVSWSPAMAVEQTYGADGGEPEPDWHWRYRSMSYQLFKNYGVRPTVLARLLGRSCSDGLGALRGVLKGKTGPAAWVGNGRKVLSGIGVGLKDGLKARASDRSSRRNPRGRSTRADRAVSVYDWR
jgi:glycosyltransferase involved in cell wall biosynthesis